MNEQIKINVVDLMNSCPVATQIAGLEKELEVAVAEIEGLVAYNQGILSSNTALKREKAVLIKRVEYLDKQVDMLGEELISLIRKTRDVIHGQH